MRHIVAAGTDAASLLLFDPGALPDDYDAQMQGNPGEMLERLSSEGRLRWINTGADGAYLLHAYVEEAMPESLRQYARDPITVEHFSIPSGQLYFTGAECGFQRDDSFLREHPHMGGAFPLPPGDYRLTLFRTEYPDGFHEELLRGRVTPLAYRLHQGMGCLVGVAVAAVIAAAVTLFLRPRGFWLRYILPPAILLAMLPFLARRLAPFREASRQVKELEREYPSIIAELHRNATA